MKNSSRKSPPSNIAEEYDFSAGVRGKYARRYAEGTNLVLLEPDIAKAFPTAKAVNSSLRTLISKVARRRRLLPAKARV